MQIEQIIADVTGTDFKVNGFITLYVFYGTRFSNVIATLIFINKNKLTSSYKTKEKFLQFLEAEYTNDL